MKTILIFVLLTASVAIGHAQSNEGKVESAEPVQIVGEVQIFDQNNELITDTEVNRSQVGRIFLSIKTVPNQLIVIKKGRIFLPSKTPSEFTGSTIELTSFIPGTITISIDQVVRRHDDGTDEPVVLESKFATFTIK